ncbi:MAG TPA: phage terminase large subunit family protein [Pontiellaceae bacterium]|nr:phage terminase large subunit family protein [Pontiellaceae bacterium]
MINLHEQRCWKSIRRHYRDIFAEDPDQTVWEWCEQNVVLTELETDYPGLLDTDLTPWIREPLEAVRDDEVEEITVIAGTQVIKTLFIICAIAWWAKHRGTRMLHVMDTKDNASDFAESRLQPIFQNSESLRQLIPSDRNKWNKLRMYIGRALLNLTGSNSPGNLASRPAPFVSMDEVGKFREKTEKETDAVSLAKSRTKSKTRRKIIITSSPTYEFGLEWKAFKSGSQEVWKIQCPHCGEYIELRKDGIRWCPLAKRGGKWDMDFVADTAHYVCQLCGGQFGSSEKRKLNRSGRWSVQNPRAPRNVRSFRIPSYYSPWESCSFGNVAVHFLRCKAEFNMKDFDNNYDAMPSFDEVEKLEWEILKGRKEKYAQPYPAMAAYCTGFFDVQKGWFEWFCVAWGENNEHWVVEHEIVNADPSDLDEWKSTLDVLDRQRPIPLEWAFYDFGGNWHANAIRFVRSLGRQNVQLSFGSIDDKLPEQGRRTWTKKDVKPRTRLFEIGASQAKMKIYKMLSRDVPGRGYCHFPEFLDDEYFKQLCAEERRPKTEKGRTVYYWHKSRERNESIDGHVGCYCGKLQIPVAKRKRLYLEAAERRKEVRASELVPDQSDPSDASETIKPKAQGLKPSSPLPPPPSPAKPVVQRVQRRAPRGWMQGY